MDERVDRSETRIAPERVSRVTPVAPRPRTGYWILTAIVVAGLGGGGWYLWSQRDAQQTPKNIAAGRSGQGLPQPVGFARIDKGNVRIILNELGTVSSLDTVTVQTQINGQLQQVGFKEGQIVKKGDFLAQIDPRPYIAALEQAQGTLAHGPGIAGPGADQPEALPDPGTAGFDRPATDSTISASWCSSTPGRCRPTRARSIPRS